MSALTALSSSCVLSIRSCKCIYISTYMSLVLQCNTDLDLATYACIPVLHHLIVLHTLLVMAFKCSWYMLKKAIRHKFSHQVRSVHSLKPVVKCFLPVDEAKVNIMLGWYASQSWLTALLNNLSAACRQSGGANRQQHADQNVMQVGMEAILKLASDAVGRNVHVFLSEHGSWYNARVRQCLPGQGTVHVQYESGEKDVLKAKEQGKRYNIRLMPISVRTAA